MGLIVPKVVGGDEVLAKGFGSKRVIKRWFQYPRDEKPKDWMLWGGEVSTLVFPVTTKGEVVALRQFRHGANKILIELPGGHPSRPDSKEKFEDTAREELRQETGFFAKRFQILADEEWLDSASCFVYTVPVLATGCEGVAKPRPEKTEVLEVVLYSIADWIAGIYATEIRDQKTIMATFLALGKLGYQWVPPDTL